MAKAPVFYNYFVAGNIDVNLERKNDLVGGNIDENLEQIVVERK